MFKWYGVFGILLIILVEINFFLKIEPFASFYFPLIWLGYILVVDAIIYKLKRNSLAMNRRWQFIGLFFLSAVFWWIFEFINLRTGNWWYKGTLTFEFLSLPVRRTIYFVFVLPAIFETTELVRSIHLFDKIKLHKKYRITKRFLHVMFGIGIVCFVLPLIWPYLFFPLVWLAFFFLLDPINYLHKQPSVIQHLKDRKLVIPLSLLAAGVICGFFWEFWNYWAVTKWYYELPWFVSWFKVFEMPILGYLGYFPFAFELYAMYWFVRSLFIKKEKLLV